MKVTVNGEVFGHDICMFQLQRLSQDKPGLSEIEAKKEIADNFIRHALLKQHAVKKTGAVPERRIENELKRLKQNYPNDAEFQRMCRVNGTTEEAIRKEIEESLKIELFIRELTKHVPPPPMHIMKKYYERERKVSMKPKEIHAAHIVKKIDPENPEKVYNEMLQIRKQLLDGNDFAEVADKYSSCNDEGGDLGYFSRGKMVEEFDVILFSMNIGEVSPVFQTPFGYHIATVYDIKAPERLSFEECEDEIREEIVAKLHEECVNKWVKKERPNASVEVEF